MHYVWRKQAAVEWVTRSEAALASFAAAIIERPHRKELVVEVTGDHATAQRLARKFGGTVRCIGKREWQDWLTPPAHKPLRIGRRLCVVNQAGRWPNELLIPAGAAFGTGEHPTTAMSLRLLEERTRRLQKWSLLDLGSGSGILALGAAKLGAARVLAIDNDPIAIRTAKQNARLNRVRRVQFRLGDAVQPATRETFDVVTANLYSDLLVRGLPRWRKLIGPNGELILSGILRTQERDVLRALKGNHLEVLTIRRRPKWIAILLRARDNGRDEPRTSAQRHSLHR